MNLEPEIGSVEEKHESAVQPNRKTISRGKSQLNRGNENGYNGFLSNGVGGGGEDYPTVGIINRHGHLERQFESFVQFHSAVYPSSPI